MKELAKTTDKRLAELYAKESDLLHRLKSNEEQIRHAAGQQMVRKDYEWQWSGTWEEALHSPAARVQELLASGKLIQEAVSLLYSEIRPLEAIFREHRWSRFYLVPAGHIHSSMRCHSCYFDTQYAWLPELSGDTEEEAVAAEGEILCTFCFPSAPVAWTAGIGRRTQEERDAKAAEKAAKLAAKVAKSLSLDGSVVSISSPPSDTNRWSRWKEFKTLRAAELWLGEAYAYQMRQDGMWWFGAPDAYSVENVRLVLEMVATKVGKPVEEVEAALVAKADAKIRKA